MREPSKPGFSPGQMQEEAPPADFVSHTRGSFAFDTQLALRREWFEQWARLVLQFKDETEKANRIPTTRLTAPFTEKNLSLCTYFLQRDPEY